MGDGSFSEAYKLLWFLENGPAFYKVDGVDIKRLEKKDFEYGSYANSAEVTMVLKLSSFQRQGGPEIKTLAVEEDHSLDLASLFTSSGGGIKPIKKSEQTRRTTPVRSYSPDVANRVPQPERNTTGLPEINGDTKVLALTPSWVMIQTKDGKKIKLTIGQKVYQGYLNEIRTDSNEAVFKINRGAVPEDFVLSVAYQKRRY